jgi:hypothetical protein
MGEQVVMRMENHCCSLCDPPKRSQGTGIVGSVGRGGRNIPDDVKAIQSALNAQDVANGGPSVKLAVDGLCGPLTIAAIEQYQTRQLGWSDGRVDPDGPTIHALNGGADGAVAPEKRSATKPTPRPKATPAENKAFIEEVGAKLPIARHWVSLAQLKLDLASDFVRRTPANRALPALGVGQSEFALFNKYFHADKQPRGTELRQLRQVRRIYDLMQQVLTESLLQAPMFGWGVGYFQPDPKDGTLAAAKYLAYTFFGGWHRKGSNGKPRMSSADNYVGTNLREDTIFFPVGMWLNRYLAADKLPVIIIHELAHFVGPPWSSGDRIGDYTGSSLTALQKLNNWTALHNAESFAVFAAESALGPNLWSVWSLL